MAAKLAGEACSYFLARLDFEVARLREVDFPGHDVGPRIWLSLIQGFLETAKGYLDSANQPSVSNDRSSRYIRDAEQLGQSAYKLLQHVAGADATQIPHQVVAPFKRWVRRLQIENTMFFRAEHLPNYELSRYDLSDAITDLNNPSALLVETSTKITWPILRVTVPSQAMGMLPHFAVVAHELGHAIEDKINVDLTVHQNSANHSASRIRDRLNQNGQIIDTNTQLRVRTIFQNWINEIKADTVGHFLTGPAYFFAFSGFLELALPGYGVWPGHPPSDLRRRLLFDRLTEGTPSFNDVFRSRTGLSIEVDTNSPHLQTCPPPDQLFDILKDKHGIVDAAICVELVPYIADLAPEIFESTKAYIESTDPTLIYTPTQLDHDLGFHLDALSALIPPIETTDATGIRQATELASVLNVGWAALLTRLDHMPDTSGTSNAGTSKQMERLHELLLKAVELSEARQLWDEV